MRSRLRANILGLGERDVAVVFDDEPVESRTGIRARVVERSIVDRLDFGPTMIRGTRQRQKMHDAYQHAVGTAEYRLQSMIAFARDGRHIAHVIRSARSRRGKMFAISSRVGKDESTPARPTQIAAAWDAARNASTQASPSARPATSVPQKTSPAPTVSTAATCGACARNVSLAETSAEPAAPSVTTTDPAPAPSSTRAASTGSSRPPSSSASPRLRTTRSTRLQS